MVARTHLYGTHFWVSVLGLGVFLPLLGSLISISLLNDWRLPYTEGHALLEVMGGLLAITIFAFLFYGKQNDFFSKKEIACVASAMITMGILDLFHALVDPGKIFVWFHSLATFLGGLCFACVVLPVNPDKLFTRIIYAVLAFTLAITGLSLVFQDSVPAMLQMQEHGHAHFTFEARALNILGGVGFFVGSYHFFLKYRDSGAQAYALLVAHCLLFGMAGVLFELSSIWDAAWWWWHILRFVAYAILGVFFYTRLRQQAFTLSAKVAALCFLISFFSSVLVGSFLYQSYYHSLKNTVVKNLVQEANLLKPIFKNQYEVMHNDLFVLKGTPPIQGIIRAAKSGGVDPKDGSTTALWKHRLEDIFVAMIKSKPSYLQIRYIGLEDNGRELVRVDKKQSGVVRIPPSNLQQKGDETYIKASTGYPDNSIYLSAVTLNRENGKVQVPHVPVLRSVTPVYDLSGKQFGMIVINASYEGMLAQTIEKLDLAAEIYVVNSRGDYIHKKDKASNWQFTLSRSVSEDRKSEVVQKIHNSKKDALSQIINQGGSDIFLHAVKLRYNPSDPNQYLSIGLAFPADIIYQQTANIRKNAIILSVLFILFASVTGLVLGTYITTPLNRVITSLREMSEPGHTQKTELPIENRDEIGELARTFASLTNSLFDSEARSRSVINTVVDGIIAIDEDGVIEIFNPACEKIFGYTAEEMIGKNVKCLMPDRHSSRHDYYLHNYKETGNRTIIGTGRELEGITKNGKIFPLDLSVSEVYLKDRRIFCGVVRDISERKKLEREKEHVINLLKKSNEELDEFAYIASHDLKAPLRVIDNASQWLEEDLEEFLDDDTRENMELLRSRVTRMENLLNDLLQYSRIGRKLDGSHSEIVNAKALVDEVIELLSPPDGFTIHVSPEFAKHEVHLMPLKQIFINLINNAIKHHDKDTGTIDLHIKDLGDSFEFSVADDGPGIDPQFHDKAFKLFQTLKPRDQVEGSGMGLAYIKKTIASVEGHIILESEAGKGCKFSFTIPKGANINMKEAS